MMADNVPLPLSIPQTVDAFCFGSLNEALDELEILNSKSVEQPKTGFDFNGVKIRGVRSASSLNTLLGQRRIASQPARVGIEAITNENMVTPVSRSPFECNSKVLQSRAHRARVNPYYRRRPLYSLGGHPSSVYHGDSLSNRLNGCQLTNGDYYLRSLRSVNSLPRLCQAEVIRRIPPQTINFQPSSFLFDDELNRKTEDYCSYPLPLPVLTRSKSLEDLRESVKPKVKSLSTDMTSGSVSSFDASLSPRRRSNCGRNCGYQGTFPMLYPRRIFENNSTSSSRSISSKDVDSMSLQIGKLDVS